MKFKILFPFLSATLLLPLPCSSQQWGPPTHHFEKDAYEQQDDSYLPNAYNNKKLSPAYRDDGRSDSRTSNTEIFTRQVNVSPGQNNIMGDAASSINLPLESCVYFVT